MVMIRHSNYGIIIKKNIYKGIFSRLVKYSNYKRTNCVIKRFLDMKLNLVINLIIKFTDKMFSNSKNLSHQQALNHIQTLFPAVALPSFSSKINLKTILEVTLT